MSGRILTERQGVWYDGDIEMIPKGWDKPLETATGEEVGVIIGMLIGVWIVIVGIVWIITIITHRRMKNGKGTARSEF